MKPGLVAMVFSTGVGFSVYFGAPAIVIGSLLSFVVLVSPIYKLIKTKQIEDDLNVPANITYPPTKDIRDIPINGTYARAIKNRSGFPFNGS